MGASGLGFEMDNEGRLAWAWPADAPDLTDDQARTIALANLSAAVERLARAIEWYSKKLVRD